MIDITKDSGFCCF